MLAVHEEAERFRRARQVMVLGDVVEHHPLAVRESDHQVALSSAIRLL